MPRYKPVDRSPRFLPIILDEQIQPGTFEFALDHLIDNELDLSGLDAKFNNEATGATAYDPRVMLKIVLLGYSRGLISSRAIERACRDNVLFMAISGDLAPAYTSIAKFVRELGQDIRPLFTQVLLVCDQMGLIGREMFAIDGVKLPANASKECSGTHAELAHKADRYDQAARKILAAHQTQDEGKNQAPPDNRRDERASALSKQAERIRSFIAGRTPRCNPKGQELKDNVTDPDSAKMATSKGVIQGYAAQAAVDARNQIIVAAEVIGSGSEQQALLPMVDASANFRETNTLITADAGYHSNHNLQQLRSRQIPALIADNEMRRRDERFKDHARYKSKPDPLYDKTASPGGRPMQFQPSQFQVDLSSNTCICPAGQKLYSSGSNCTVNGRRHHKFKGTLTSCGACKLRDQCLRYPQRTPVRQVAIFFKNQPSPNEATELMKKAIDSDRGRRLYSQRIATVEPVFANLRYNKRLTRFTLRSHGKVSTQWQLYCLVHNIEKIAKA